MGKPIKLNYRSGYKGDGPLQKFLPLDPGTKQINEATREITFVVSTSGRDRDGDVIMQDGWNLDNYMKNPIVLWAHDPSQPPVARTKRISVQGNKLIATAQFPDKDTYEFGNTVYQMYKGGFLNATSVGFQPTELELMEGPEPGDFGFRFVKQELMEFSAVPIPSNPEALIVARGQGLDIAPLKTWIERTLDEHGAGGMEDVLQRSFVALNGKLHPSLQDRIARKNADALRKMSGDSAGSLPADPEVEEEAGDQPPPQQVVSTGPVDNPDAAEAHTHQLAVGEAQTEPSEEDGHMHAVEYDEAGNIVVQDAEGHGHEVSASAAPEEDAMDEDEDEEKGNENPQTDDDVEVETPIADPTHPNYGQPTNQRATNTPRFKALIEASEYQDVFPVAEAKALREDWPELWEAGEHGARLDKLLAGEKNVLISRDKWAAKHIDDWDLAGVIGQVQNLVIGSRGIKHMREVLSHAKQDLVEQSARRVPQKESKPAPKPEVDQDALIERVIERAVLPAVEAAIRRHSGRVS